MNINNNTNDVKKGKKILKIPYVSKEDFHEFCSASNGHRGEGILNEIIPEKNQVCDCGWSSLLNLITLDEIPD